MNRPAAGLRFLGWRSSVVCLLGAFALAPLTADAAEAPASAPGETASAGSDSPASVLIDRAAWCVATDCGEDAASLLEQARAQVLKQPASAQRVSDLLQIARLQAQLADGAAARVTLQEARRSLPQVRPASSQLELEQRLALGFAALGEPETARAIEADVQSRQAAIAQASSYPFPGGPGRLSAGLAVSGTSFDDFTTNGTASLSVFKPWINQDLTFDFIGSLNYDSGRDVNKLKPNVSSASVYRYHLTDQWNLFAANFTAVNSGVIAGSTDDEDTSVLNATYLGPGLNLWRGKQREQFVDLLLGMGARYEYEEVNLETVKEDFAPSVALFLYGRGLSIGKATLAPTVGVGLGSDSLDELVLYGDVNLKVPLSGSWAWNSRVLARYTSEQVVDLDEKLNYQFFTGLTYTFKP